MNRTKPKMILFDYGHTLLYEPDLNFLRGEQAVFSYIKENPREVTPEEACRFGTEMFERYHQARKLGFEIHEWQCIKFKYESLGISFDLSPEEIERVVWTNTSPGACMPHVEEMLTCLRAQGIRSGVISNIGWSGKALTERIHRLLPHNEFEFILASSEYGVRKPHRDLFDLALKKAGLSPEQVWYCGDSIANDVMGAHGVGMFPVLYEGKSEEESPYVRQNADMTIDFDYLHIRDWREMITLLEELQ